MIKRDYILRMIEEIGKFLSKLSGLKNDQLDEKGFDEFLIFIETHFGLKENQMRLDNFEFIKEKLKSSYENLPDDLGQLFFNGAELAENANKRDKAEVLYLLAWDAFQKAEKDTQTFRFDRAVDLNAVKEKLGLMGINVENIE